MNFSKITDPRLLTLISFILWGNLGYTPVSANEPPIISGEEVQPLETPTGVSQDLIIFEAKDNPQWPWQVGDQPESNGSPDYTIDVNTADDSPSVDLKKEDQEWQNLHRGDPRESGGKVPLADF